MKRPADTGANRAARYAHLHARIATIARANPEMTSREIAARVGCGHRLVQRVRAAMEAK